MLNWWVGPIHKAGVSTPFTSGISSSYISGVAPAGYAAFAFAAGAAAGLFIRRTLPAMAVTLAVSAAVMTAFPVWVRPHLIPPAQATVTLSTTSIIGTMFVSPARRALYVQTAPPHIPGAWILSTQLTTPDGRPASSVPYTAACGQNSAFSSCQDYIASLHLRQTVTYQPASRYWDFQWIETGIYLALALILAGLCLLRIRPGRPAEPDIHRPQAIRSAPALERFGQWLPSVADCRVGRAEMTGCGKAVRARRGRVRHHWRRAGRIVVTRRSRSRVPRCGVSRNERDAPPRVPGFRTRSCSSAGCCPGRC